MKYTNIVFLSSLCLAIAACSSDDSSAPATQAVTDASSDSSSVTDSSTSADSSVADSAVEDASADSSAADAPAESEPTDGSAKEDTAADAPTSSATGTISVKNESGEVHTCTVTSGSCSVELGIGFMVRSIANPCDVFAAGTVKTAGLNFAFGGTAAPTDGTHDLAGNALELKGGKVWTTLVAVSVRTAKTGTVDVQTEGGKLHVSIKDMPFLKTTLEPAVEVTADIYCP